MYLIRGPPSVVMGLTQSGFAPTTSDSVVNRPILGAVHEAIGRITFGRSTSESLTIGIKLLRISNNLEEHK